jgi:hypothetical protein
MGSGEKIMDESQVLTQKLVSELTRCTDLHSELLEWKQLHDHLQGLEANVDLIVERVQGEPIDIEPHLREIESVWSLCEDIISHRLVPFARGIEHIGRRYEERDGKRYGEDWIVKIVQAQTDVSQDLHRLRLGPLQEHIGYLSSLITKHLFRADVKLQQADTALNELCTRLSLLVADEFLGDDLAEGLIRFVEGQQRMLEWMRLHEVYQKLRTNYISIYRPVKQQQPRELALMISMIGRQWKFFKNTVFWELIAFARDISYIGEPYKDDEGALSGEGWVVKLVQLERAIDQALKDHSLVLLHESVCELGTLIGQYFIEVDKRFLRSVNDSNALSAELKRRIGS